MTRLDKLLDKIEGNSKIPLKSEQVYGKFVQAKKNLDIKVSTLAEVIDQLNKTQLDNLNIWNKPNKEK